MSLTTIRAAAATTIRTVTGIGTVHEYQRWCATWDKFLTLFKDANDKINGCMITRVRTPEDEGRTALNERDHELKIICIYGLQDETASEIYFQDTIVEGICTALRNNRNLNKTAVSCSPPSVEVVDIRKFGNVLCHYAEIKVVAKDIEKRG